MNRETKKYRVQQTDAVEVEPSEERTFSPREIEDIVKIAASRQKKVKEKRDGLTYSELEEVAIEANISPEDLALSIAEYDSTVAITRKQEQERREVLELKRQHRNARFSYVFSFPEDGFVRVLIFIAACIIRREVMPDSGLAVSVATTVGISYILAIVVNLLTLSSGTATLKLSHREKCK